VNSKADARSGNVAVDNRIKRLMREGAVVAVKTDAVVLQQGAKALRGEIVAKAPARGRG
jgi:hypothetical protein